MEPRIDLGRFDERPTAAGVTREAHGQFVGPNGEKAGYAFGWATDTSPAEARLTIGIGAGDAGGGTFHARIVEHDGGYAFGLTDQPFTDVLGGGPHLTTAQARRHDDLAFVWWVADFVMEHDPRALWMVAWLLGTTAITTRQVAEGSEPVLLVVHDEEEEPPEWQLIGRSDAAIDGKILHLSHLLDRDPTLAQVLDLQPGEQAARREPAAAWERG